MPQTVLILGASGRFGRHAAVAFKQRGWRVKTFNRRTDQLDDAVQGVDVIVNAWNPAYPDWAAEVPRLHAQVIAAAQLVDATVIVPGNVYVYGPTAPYDLTQNVPHAATNPLGVIRRDMEQAYRDSGVRTILLRAGDFIDTQPSGNWFDKIMTPKLGKGSFVYPGAPDCPHAWAFLPDLARAAVELTEQRETLQRYEDIPFPGYTLTGIQLAHALEQVCAHPVRLRQFNWLPIQLAVPFWRLARNLLEMRYLWDMPHSLSGDRFDTLLPGFRHTPLRLALSQAVPQQEVRPLLRVQNPISAQTIL